MDSYGEKVIEAVKFLKDRLDDLPVVGLLAGTGLGPMADAITASREIEYKEIPHFPAATVESHSGKLVIGRLQNIQVVAMRGRFHLYEGYTPREVTFPIRVMQMLGIGYLIVSNASGGLNPEFSEGDIMIISDHINLTGSNPLAGLRGSRWGNRFPDMTGAYHKDLRRFAEDAGKKTRIRLRSGVYAGLAGPSLETPAETRFLKIIGADAVGFSTVHEVIAAVQAGMNVLGLSVITNMNNPDHPVPATAGEIISVAKRTAPELAAVVKMVVEKIRNYNSKKGTF